MTFVDSIRTCFKKYADFKGCASVSEFWWWVLFTVIAGLALGVISDRLSTAFSILTFVPGMAVAARRLHDTNRSGWLQLLVFIPIIGLILLIVWWVQERKDPNQYCSEAQEVAV
jgi:uncharacterized membrane protein YhaH (DUF805 family)